MGVKTLNNFLALKEILKDYELDSKADPKYLANVVKFIVNLFQVTCGASGGKLQLPESFLDYPNENFLLGQHGFTALSFNREKKEFLVDAYLLDEINVPDPTGGAKLIKQSVPGLHLQFSSQKPGFIHKENTETETDIAKKFRSIVLKICDDYFASLKEKQLQKMQMTH